MAEKLIRVCDVCGGIQEVTTFTITERGAEVNVDLCSEHAAPVRAAVDSALGDAAKKAPPRKAAPRKPSGMTVTPMSEVKRQIRDPFQAP